MIRKWNTLTDGQRHQLQTNPEEFAEQVNDWMLDEIQSIREEYAETLKQAYLYLVEIGRIKDGDGFPRKKGG